MKLLACPFCGEDTGENAPRLEWRTPLKDEWPKMLCKVHCMRCDSRTGEFESEDGAIERWNLRTKPKSEWSIKSESTANGTDGFDEWKSQQKRSDWSQGST